MLEALAAVGAEEHHALLQQFVSTNGIDLFDLDSFACRSIKAYRKQTTRFDFDSFDVFAEIGFGEVWTFGG